MGGGKKETEWIENREGDSIQRDGDGGEGKNEGEII